MEPGDQKGELSSPTTLHQLLENIANPDPRKIVNKKELSVTSTSGKNIPHIFYFSKKAKENQGGSHSLLSSGLEYRPITALLFSLEADL